MTNDRRNGRWVCLDVGETLIDETRFWGLWADALGVSLLTFGAVLGATIEQGRHHQDVFSALGVPDFRAIAPRIEEAFGGFRAVDLYPDALPTIARLEAQGYRVAIIANQPAARAEQLAALGIRSDVFVMSESIGVSKPDPAFFRRSLELMGHPSPEDVAYVGDRVDNDVVPSRAAGMRAIWLRRGPWGRVQQDSTNAAHLIVESLTELTERIEEAWITSAPSARTTRTEPSHA